MDTEPTTVSLSLTHINYDPNDPVSYLCAWLSLLPQGLIVAYVVLSWSSREIEIILTFAGQLACEALNFALKRIIREERPNLIHRSKGYGMPSSHSQFMAFFAVYVGLFLLIRHKPRFGSRDSNSLSKYLPSPYAQQVLTAIYLLVNAVGVGISRIYLSYHTQKQVLVGLGIGTLFAFAWFAFTGALRSTGLLQRGLDLEVVRLFRVRDLLLTEDLVESGWERYEQQRTKRVKSRSRKSR